MACLAITELTEWRLSRSRACNGLLIFLKVLPVPELVPFRLTRQLVGLLQPHPVKRGEFRQVMVHCLSALRSRADEILPLLDVFVRDPSVDWLVSCTIMLFVPAGFNRSYSMQYFR